MKKRVSRRVHFLGLVVFENSWEGVFVSDLPAMVPGLVAYTASAALVEITVPVRVAHAIKAAV